MIDRQVLDIPTPWMYLHARNLASSAQLTLLC